ncbi:HAUS augmin-like complex subunit 5 [Glandiceps talaboti]
MSKHQRRKETTNSDNSCNGIANAGPDQIAKCLSKWVVEEMGVQKLPGQQLPVAEDLERVCRGNMINIWKFVLNNVHSRQTVQKIQGNLAIHGKGEFSKDREDMLQRKRELEAELNVSERHVNVLEGEVERLEREIMKTEKEYQKSCQTVNEMRHRDTLLSAYSTQCKAGIEKRDAYHKQIEDIVTKYKKRTSSGYTDTFYFNKQRDGSTDSEDVALETACGRNVREACEAIGSFHHQLIKGQFADHSIIQKKRHFLWTKIEDIIREQSASKVLLAVTDNAIQSGASLKEITARLDINNDIELLKFKYDKGNFKDVANPQDVSQTVHKLLEDSHNDLIAQFVEKEKYNQQNQKSQEKLEIMQNQVIDQLATLYSEQTGGFHMAKALLESEIQLVSERAVTTYLEEICEQLEQKAQRNVQERTMLEQKYNKIQNFNQVVEANQNLIHVLLQQNSNSKGRLEKRQQQLLRYIETTLSSHEGDTVSMVTQMKDSVKTETDKFSSLSLPCLMLTTMDGEEPVTFANLSINCLDNIDPRCGGDTVQRTLAAVAFPLYKSPECVLPRLIQRKVEIDDMILLIKSQDELKAVVTGLKSTGDADTIKNLMVEMSLHDKEQISKLLPTLQTCLSEIIPAKQKLGTIKNLVNAWWIQPAQNLVTWVTVDKMTFQQVQDRWTAASTQLIQRTLSTRK